MAYYYPSRANIGSWVFGGASRGISHERETFLQPSEFLRSLQNSTDSLQASRCISDSPLKSQCNSNGISLLRRTSISSFHSISPHEHSLPSLTRLHRLAVENAQGCRVTVLLSPLFNSAERLLCSQFTLQVRCEVPRNVKLMKSLLKVPLLFLSSGLAKRSALTSKQKRSEFLRERGKKSQNSR